MTPKSSKSLTVLTSKQKPNGCRNAAAFFVPDAASLIKAKACVKLASLMIFTLPGMPSVYYGDEAGLQGMKDPFNRKPYPWGREDGELLGWYRSITALRDAVFRNGELFIDTAGSLLSIRRSLEGEWRYVLINPADDTVETLLDGSYFKGEPSLILDTGLGVQFSPRENGYYLLLPPRSGVVLK